MSKKSGLEPPSTDMSDRTTSAMEESKMAVNLLKRNITPKL